MSEEEVDKETKESIEYWIKLMKTKGKWDDKKIRAELHDLIFIFHQVSEVYCHITGGMLSKPMYYAKTITDSHDACVDEAYAEGRAELLNELRTLVKSNVDTFNQTANFDGIAEDLLELIRDNDTTIENAE
jgi:hypothetical protein